MNYQPTLTLRGPRRDDEELPCGRIPRPRRSPRTRYAATEKGLAPPRAARRMVRPLQAVLHVAPDGVFSVVAVVWQPGQTIPIHDHGSWCVVGVYEGEEEEISYPRGTRPRARPSRASDDPLVPGRGHTQGDQRGNRQSHLHPRLRGGHRQARQWHQPRLRRPALEARVRKCPAGGLEGVTLQTARVKVSGNRSFS